MVDINYVVIVKRNEPREGLDVDEVKAGVKHTVAEAVEYAKWWAEREQNDEVYYEVFRVIPLTGAQGGRKRFRYVEPLVQARVEEF